MTLSSAELTVSLMPAAREDRVEGGSGSANSQERVLGLDQGDRGQRGPDQPCANASRQLLHRNGTL